MVSKQVEAKKMLNNQLKQKQKRLIHTKVDKTNKLKRNRKRIVSPDSEVKKKSQPKCDKTSETKSKLTHNQMFQCHVCQQQVMSLHDLMIHLKETKHFTATENKDVKNPGNGAKKLYQLRKIY